jgi:cysteine desulfuration protein SufE
MSLEEIKETFDLIEDWEDRYAYVIELGKALAPYPSDQKDELHRIKGCASQVWLSLNWLETKLDVMGDGDAFIVRGLIAIVIAAYNGKTAQEILAFDAFSLFQELGFTEHISNQRANGLRAMIAKIREEAEIRA